MGFKSLSAADRQKLGYPTELLYNAAIDGIEPISKGQPLLAFKFIDDNKIDPKDVIALQNKMLTSGLIADRPSSVAQIKNAIQVISKHYGLSSTEGSTKTYLLIGGGLVVAYLLFK